MTYARTCVYAYPRVPSGPLRPSTAPPPPQKYARANANVYESHPLFGCLLILETSAADDPARNLFLANMLRRLIFHFGTSPLPSPMFVSLYALVLFFFPRVIFLPLLLFICRPVLEKKPPYTRRHANDNARPKRVLRELAQCRNVTRLRKRARSVLATALCRHLDSDRLGHSWRD